MPLKSYSLLPAIFVALTVLGTAQLAAQELAGGRTAGATASHCPPGFHFNQWRRCLPNRSVNDASRDAFDPRHTMASAPTARPADHPTNIDVCPPSLHPSHSGQCIPNS